MTVENARQFIEALDTNPTLSTQFSVVSPRNLEDVIDFASEKGYFCTVDELESALKDYPESAVARQLRQFTR